MRDTQVEGMETRSSTRGDLTEIGGSTRAKKSFTIDAAKVWNKALEKKRTAKTMATAKKGNQRAFQNFTHLEMLKIVGKRC